MGDTPSNRRRGKGPTGRTKVKSGCRTCKIRKVKCDEGRPACRRCVSTGRVCDGYGIWGGGNHQQSLRSPRCVSLLAATSTEEKQYFEWFKCNTIKKITGAFISPFWNTLLFQASLNEPAILHALLTLSSVHKRPHHRSSECDKIPDQQEQFMLDHYTKAIHHLQPHFSTQDRASVRVALIACVVFVCLEFLRGHFQTAQAHLHSGLKVLREVGLLSDTDDGILLLTPSNDSIDGWIVDAIARLHLQVELCTNNDQNPCLLLLGSGTDLSNPIIFQSFPEAWQELERLLRNIFHLTKRVRQLASDDFPTGYPSGLLQDHQEIHSGLVRWLDTYHKSKSNLRRQDHRGLGGRLLHQYYTMAKIMAGACLWPDDESVFDSYTEQFISLITQSVEMWELGSPNAVPLSMNYMDMSRSIIDLVWIAPLYYAALKCRIHRIRLQAIRLLESASHREGMWDSRITSCVARTVMKFEERNFYRDVETDDNFPLSSRPELRDLSMPSLPQSYRICEVKVVLSDGPVDSVLMIYRQRPHTEDWKEVHVSL